MGRNSKKILGPIQKTEKRKKKKMRIDTFYYRIKFEYL